jgi:hypothetical protein
MQRLADAILLFVTYQRWIYIALASLGAVLILVWWWAGHKLRYKIFGLERESLKNLRARSMTSLMMVICIGVSIWMINSFIAPNLSELMGIPFTPTPPKATNTPAPTATSPLVLPGFQTPTSQATTGPTPTKTKVPAAGSGCLNPKAGITSPIPGSILSGEIEVRGNTNIDNFAFYVVQVSTLGQNWLTVITDRKPLLNGSLGKWDTRLQTPGEYALRLVVYDSAGKFPEPCTIPITIVPLPTKTPEP